MNDANTTLLVRDAEDRSADLRAFDRLLETVFSASPTLRARAQQPAFGWAPAIDIRETDTELIAYVALPGLDKEDVSLELKDNVLALSGRIKPLGSEEDAWIRRELPRGEFYRAFHLPADVQAAKVKATMNRGLLEIRLPKSEEARPRKVVID